MGRLMQATGGHSSHHLFAEVRVRLRALHNPASNRPTQPPSAKVQAHGDSPERISGPVGSSASASNALPSDLGSSTGAVSPILGIPASSPEAASSALATSLAS